VNVADNHFVSNFFGLTEETPRFKIAAELLFQDRESGFHELTSGIDDTIEVSSHFQTIRTSNDLVIPGPDRDNRIGVKVFANQSVNSFRVVTSVHTITIGLSELVT
jgi:hypothetical protein